LPRVRPGGTDAAAGPAVDPALTISDTRGYVIQPAGVLVPLIARQIAPDDPADPVDRRRGVGPGGVRPKIVTGHHEALPVGQERRINRVSTCHTEVRE
jgi:hypothetical protein